MKIYQAVQKFLVRDIKTDRQTGDLISLLSFFENRLKKYDNKTDITGAKGTYILQNSSSIYLDTVRLV
jgi:hypothetical protein